LVRLAAGGVLAGLVVLVGFLADFDFVDAATWIGAGFGLTGAGVLEAVAFLGVLDLPGDVLLLVFLDDFGGADLSAMVSFEDYSTYRLTICGTILLKQSAMN
jgi:hypothetical protein